MGTVNDPKMVAAIIRNNGVYKNASGEDPPCVAIYSYVNDWGKVAYSLCYSAVAAQDVQASPHCHNVKLLWDTLGILVDGELFLETVQQRE